MADFTTVMTSSAALDDTQIEEFDTAFRLELTELGVMDQFATLRRDINAKSISFPKYNQLALQTTPLTDKEDPVSEVMVDSEVVITPVEYGNTVTTTKIVNLQTGGKADAAAAQIVAINMLRSQNRKAMIELDTVSSGQIITTNAGGIGSIASTDILSGDFMNQAYNRLARNNVEGVAGNEFVMVAHDDVIHDIRAGQGGRLAA